MQYRDDNNMASYYDDGSDALFGVPVGPEESHYCICKEDWTDGGAICQECKKPRR